MTCAANLRQVDERLSWETMPGAAGGRSAASEQRSGRALGGAASQTAPGADPPEPRPK